MKKILLSVALFATTIAFSQTLQTENFDGLNLGNVGTDLTGATAGQGNLLTFVAAAGNNSDFQIITEGTGKSLQLVGSATAANSRFLWKDGLATAWTGRTTGNNVINLEFDLFTGGVTTSKNRQNLYIYDATGSKVLSGFSFVPETKTLLGVCYLDNAGTLNNYSLNLGATPVVLPSNQWIKLGMSFNKTTGLVTWKGPTFEGTYTGAAAGVDPSEIDFVMAAGTANTVAYTGKYDNFIVSAKATSDLLGTKDFEVTELGLISVFPNPAKDILNVNINGSNINAIQIVDLNGRQVFTKSFENVSDAQINVNNLSAGMYLINITSGDKSVTKKFLKQ